MKAIFPSASISHDPYDLYVKWCSLPEFGNRCELNSPTCWRFLRSLGCASQLWSPCLRPLRCNTWMKSELNLFANSPHLPEGQCRKKIECINHLFHCALVDKSPTSGYIIGAISIQNAFHIEMVVKYSLPRVLSHPEPFQMLVFSPLLMFCRRLHCKEPSFSWF